MNADFAQKQKMYNKWHKELYQTDINHALYAQKNLNKNILSQLNIDASTQGKLLDVACGKGIFLHELRKSNKKIQLYGSDISDTAITEAKKIVDATFFVEPGEQLQSSNNFFDYIVSSGGLEYYDDTLKGTKELARVLKKNGKVVIFVPNLMFLGYIWLAFKNGMMPTHGGSNGETMVYDFNSEKFYTFQGWKAILERAGLHVEKSTSYNYIGSTRFANKIILWLYNKFLYKMIPFNLSYSFVYICRKK